MSRILKCFEICPIGKLHPCAYLHNYNPDTVITHSFYEPHIKKAPTLQPLNKTYSPIHLTENDEFHVIGEFLGVL